MHAQKDAYLEYDHVWWLSYLNWLVVISKEMKPNAKSIYIFPPIEMEELS